MLQLAIRSILKWRNLASETFIGMQFRAKVHAVPKQTLTELRMFAIFAAIRIKAETETRKISEMF